MDLADPPAASSSDPWITVDAERRFGGLRRLYGAVGYERIRAARFAIVGLGGVGSWVAEALARSGVAGLILIDLDQVAESNVNRQVQALGSTVGQAKVTALADRIRDIHPGCEVDCVEEFVDADNWPALLTGQVDAVIDACDNVRAKAAIGGWALGWGGAGGDGGGEGKADGSDGARVGSASLRTVIVIGAAGGKRRPQGVEVADLADVTHDPLLASLRQRLRKQGAAVRSGAIGLRCVFSREQVRAPEAAIGAAVDGSLNCHGYGSSVTVTATFGMVAAALALESALSQ